MANPRQRRKAKSSTHKAISHTKRAKRLQKKMPAIRGPKALQDAWDRSKTLRQNYLALGLEHDLNPIASGGSEVNFHCSIDRINTSQLRQTSSSSATDNARSSSSEQATVTSGLPKGFGRIIRDSAGNVVRVELPSDEEVEHASKRDVVVDTPTVATNSELRIWAHDRTETSKGAGPRGMGNIVIQDLEKLAASATVRERYASLGERSYLERLVKKYGGDLIKMARDRRLNPEQRTVNELKRAFAKAGGYEVLCKHTDSTVAE